MHKPFSPPPPTDATCFPRAWWTPLPQLTLQQPLDHGTDWEWWLQQQEREIGQCDSEISRRGLSSSLDPPTSAPPAPPWSLLHLSPKPAGINGNYILITMENGNILSQRDRKAPFIVYVMLQACSIIESYNILSWEGVQVLTHLLLW